MEPFEDLRNEKISIQREGKIVYENIRAIFSKNQDEFDISASNRVINDGDKVIRSLPNERTEIYDIFGTHYISGSSGFPASYKLLVSRQGKKHSSNKVENNKPYFVDPMRIDELKKIKSSKFDFKKLILFCEELNSCSSSSLFSSMAMVQRAIIDHVPPIFGCKNFAEVSNNYSGGSKSFKAQMAKLDESLRKIADQHLHTHIRSSESLPTRVQVDFSSDIDVLLSEIVRIS